jgi:hypothetical protein
MKAKGCQGQSSIELSVVFVIILVFLLGMFRIWFWGNNDLYRRQNDYINTRGRNGTWPVHNTPALTDNWIFHGRN